MNDSDITLAVIQCSSVAVDDAKAFSHWLSAAELERNARYRFVRDQHRDMIARTLVRNVLGGCLSVDPQDLVFEASEHGKPYVVSPESAPCCFNLSHAEDWVVLAISRDPVGVDIEYTPRNNDVLAIADRFFFGDEYRQLMSYEESQRVERFFDYWTLKEAYMKARGEGISLGLSNFGFDLSRGIKLQLSGEIDDNPDDWWFYCNSPVRDYRLSLALKSSGRKPGIEVKHYRTAVETIDSFWRL